MQRYMAAADSAMRQLMAVKLVQPETTKKRFYARDEMTQWLPNVNNNAGGPERTVVPHLPAFPPPRKPAPGGRESLPGARVQPQPEVRRGGCSP